MTYAAGRPGVGISWTLELEPFLAEDGARLVDWVEFEPQTTWLMTKSATSPKAPRSAIERLQRFPGRKLVHSVALPVGGSQRPDAKHIALLRETVRELGVPFASEHLSFNAAGNVCTGFFLPPRQTEAQVRVIGDNIRRLQDALGVPIAIENGASYLRPRSDEMRDGEFIANVVDAAGCGLLLDLHNAFANAVNGRQQLSDLLAELPLHRVWELHLAGGMERDGFWLDAHSGPVPEQLWCQIRDLPARLPSLQVVIFEMFPTFVSEFGLDAVATELRAIRAWLDQPSQPQPEPQSLQEPLAPATSSTGLQPMGVDNGWEIALTELVTQHYPVSNDQARTEAWRKALAGEPGILLLRELVFSFRASMLMQVLPLTMRLLLANLGTNALHVILRDAFSQQAPRLYAALEAEAFAEYAQFSVLHVPHFAEVLRYEIAATRTLIDGQSRVVSFEVEPMPLLRALAEGYLPGEVPRAGAFEIELLSNTEVTA